MRVERPAGWPLFTVAKRDDTRRRLSGQKNYRARAWHIKAVN